MAHIFIKNSLSDLKAVKADIGFPLIVTTNSDGDPVWVLEMGSTYPTASGTAIIPQYVDKTTHFSNLDDAFAEVISGIAKQVDWGTLVSDNKAPYLTDYRPVGENVSISSNIFIVVREDVPTAGIDMSEVQVILNTGETDFDITDECTIQGSPFEYKIHWKAAIRKQESYYKGVK